MSQGTQTAACRRRAGPVAILAGSAAALVAAASLSGCPGECRFDTDCPDALACVDGACSESQALVDAREGRCETAADCALGERCTGGLCTRQAPNGNGNGEPVDQDCQATRSADCSDGLCRPTGEVAECDDPPCALLLDCMPAVGAALPGWACIEDAHCSTGWCRDGVCAATCTDNSHCPFGFDCRPSVTRPPWGDADGIAHLCEPADGTRVQCGAPRYCGEDLTCVWDYPRSASTFCAEPIAEGLSGEWCIWGDCESGVCLEGNRCSSPCQEAADCEAGSTCGTIVLTGVQGNPEVPGCVPPPEACYKPTDCEMTEHQCRTRLLLGTDHPVFQCRASSDLPTAGSPCDANNQCLSGLCTPDGVCGHVCDFDSDCTCAYGPACFSCDPEDENDDCVLEDWRCGTMPYVVGEMGYTVRVCRPPE